mgnify:CR=1 FL=1
MPENKKERPQDPEIQRLTGEIETAKKEGNYSRLKELFPQLANRQLAVGEAPRALTWINEGIEAAKGEGDQFTAARLAGLKGMALRQIGNPQQALRAYKRSERIARTLGHSPILMDALTQRGKIFAEQGKFDQAVPPLEEAYRMAFKEGDGPREMFLAGLQGDTYLAMEQQGKAMEFYTIGLEKAQELNRLEAQCSYQIAIGKIYLELEEFQPAENHFKQALDLGGRLKHPGYEFQAFENLLLMSIRQNDLERAKIYGEQSVRLAREIEDLAAEASSISDLADFLILKGEYQKALEYLGRGLELAEQAHDQEWQLKMIANQGIANYYLDETQMAEGLIERALEMALHLDKSFEAVILRSQLSAIKADLGKLEESLQVAQKTLEMAEEQELSLVVGDQKVLIGLNYYELGNPQKAVGYLKEAVEIYREMNREDLVRKTEGYLNEIAP